MNVLRFFFFLSLEYETFKVGVRFLKNTHSNHEMSAKPLYIQTVH